jgi:hypothetical protein
MKLMTKAIENVIPALYEQDGLGDDAIVHAKFFTPDGSWTWYATEYDPETRMFFGLVDGFDKELGYFSLDELESGRGVLGLPIERDAWFKPTKLGEVA